MWFAVVLGTYFGRRYLMWFPTVSYSFLQEFISRVIEGQIVVDFRSSLSDVCDVLSSLDIAIGFLASSGGQSERPLKWYLHEVLKLPKERGLKSLTVSTKSKSF